MVIEGDVQKMACVGVLLDNQDRLALRVGLALPPGPDRKPDIRWVHARDMPERVKVVAFPRWAKAAVLKNPADLVADMLANVEAGRSGFSTRLKTAKAPILPEAEEDSLSDAASPAMARTHTTWMLSFFFVYVCLF